MKRLLIAPLLLLITSCSTQQVNQPVIEREPTSAISEEIDEFDNSTRWNYSLWSTNKVSNDYGKLEEVSLSLTCTKYAQPQSYSRGSVRFVISPPSSLRLSYGGNYADFKWDDAQPELIEYDHQSGSYGDYAYFYYPKKLLRKLTNHQKLQIRYSTLTQGLQTAEFALTGKNKSYFNYFPIEKDIAELIKKCDSI